MSYIRKDIAPGESHIALRAKGISYYALGLFHLAPTYRKTIPLLISDVIKAKCPIRIYGVQGLKLNKEGCILVKNHPVSSLTISGRVMSFQVFNFFSKDGKTINEIVILLLDDSSGENSSISVKINPQEISTLGLDRDDIYVEVTGIPISHTNGERQILAKSVNIVGNSKDISTELAWWATALEARKYLSQPWVYSPPTPIVASDKVNNTRAHRDFPGYSKEGILSPSVRNFNQNCMKGDLSCATDSFAIYRNASRKRKKMNQKKTEKYNSSDSHEVGSSKRENRKTSAEPVVIEILD